jgi:hypothetical protein
MSGTIGARTAYPSGAPGFLWCSCCTIFSFLCNILMIIVCLLILSPLAIDVPVLPFMVSDYFFFWYLQEEFEDTKGVIRIRISKKNRQRNGQKKKDKQRSAKHTQKRSSNSNPIKNRGELRCFGRVSSSCCTSDTRRVNLVTHPVISREWGTYIYAVIAYHNWSC